MMRSKVKRAVCLLVVAFVLAYVVPFGSLITSFGIHGLAATVYNPALPGQTPDYCFTLFGLADRLFHFYTIGILPARAYVALTNPGDPYYTEGWMRYGVITHYTADDFAYALSVNWVTFLTWLIVLASGRFSWRRLLGPGVGARRRGITLWATGLVIELVWTTAVLRRVASGRWLGPWSHRIVTGVPLIVLLQGALLGTLAWQTRRKGASGVPTWLRNLGASTVVLALLVGVLWVILVPAIPR